MSTPLELLTLQRRAKEIERNFESIKKQYEETQSLEAPINVDEIKQKLLRIKEVVKQENEESKRKDEEIVRLKNKIKEAHKRVLKIRQAVIEESRKNSDAIFRSDIVKRLREIRQGVVTMQTERKNTIVKLKEIRKSVENDNKKSMQQTSEIESLKNSLSDKQEIIDKTYKQLQVIKETIIKESANTTPKLFQETIAKKLRKIRSEVVKLMNSKSEEKEESKVDDNALPDETPSKVPSSNNVSSENLDRFVYYTNYICPWSHRVWLTLLHKNINYELKYVSLTNKESWFTEAYKKADNCAEDSSGQVPLIQHNDFYLTDSEPLIRYLDDVVSDNRLIPSNNRDVVYMNWMIKFISFVSSAYYSILKEKDDNERIKKSKQFIEKCKVLNNRLLKSSKDGPFLFGKNVSLFEMAVIPFFDRMPIIQLWYTNEKSFKFDDIFIGNDRLKVWYNACMNLECVKRSHELIEKKSNKKYLEFFKEGYASYVKN